MPDGSHKVLFLCTGNYYRSRFAEALFNAQAQTDGLNWHAESRALNLELGEKVNVGPISIHTVRGLAQRGITLPAKLRFPRQVTEEDLAGSAVIVALKEMEHRPLLEDKHPAWATRVEYWHVHDLDQAAPEKALAEIEGLVKTLLDRLRQQQRRVEQGRE